MDRVPRELPEPQHVASKDRFDAPQSRASGDRLIQQKEPQPTPTAPEPPSEPAATDLEWRTLNFGGGSLTFIPEKVLATRTLEELGLTGSEISGVSRLKRKAQPPACQWWRMPPAGRGAYASFSIEEAIASEPVAFVGTVKRIVPGLSNWSIFVGRAVYVEVEHVLHGDFSPSLGMVAFVIPGGTIVIEGTPVCSDPDDGLHQPLVGDRLVVAGIPSDQDPLSFQEVLVLPILGAEVLPVESPLLGADAQPISVERIVPELRQEQ